MKQKPKKYSKLSTIENLTRLEAFSAVEGKRHLGVKQVKVPYIDVEEKDGGGFCSYVFDIVDFFPVFE